MNIKPFILLIILMSLLSFFAYGVSTSPTSFYVESDLPHEIVIYDKGMASLQARFDMIERAQKEILVETFIFNTDRSGKLFTKALIKKAQQGVKVRLLLDYYSTSKQMTTFHVAELKKLGIEIKYYNTTPMIFVWQAQYRTHRKLIIIDGKEAIIGGRNIADEYFDLGKKFNFYDRDLWIKGPLVESMKDSFIIFWDHKLSKNPSAPPQRPDPYDQRYEDNEYSLNYQVDLKKWIETKENAKEFVIETSNDRILRSIIKKIAGKQRPSEIMGNCNKTIFISDHPGLFKHAKRMKEHFNYWISQASTKIMMETPYFIINNQLGSTVDELLTRGVRVEALTNSLASTDAIYMNSVFLTGVKKWLKKGLIPYVFIGRKMKDYEVMGKEVALTRWVINSKTYIRDTNDFAVTTYNIDPRSSNTNAEAGIFCQDNKKMAEQLTRKIYKRVKYSRPITRASQATEINWRGTSLWKKVKYWLVKYPAYLIYGW